MDQLCVIRTDIADMPRLILESGDILLALRIADDKAVLPAVFLQPLCFGRIVERIAGIVDIQTQTGLMLGMAGTCGESVSGRLTVTRYIIVIERILRLIGAVAGSAEMSL